jgi:hypothetical protein
MFNYFHGDYFNNINHQQYISLLFKSESTDGMFMLLFFSKKLDLKLKHDRYDSGRGIVSKINMNYMNRVYK